MKFVSEEGTPIVSASSESVLDEAKRIIYKDRMDDYGNPLVNMDTIARGFSMVLRDKLSAEITAEDVMLMMIQVKVARAVNGYRSGTYQRDSLVDIAGYAGCGELIHREREARKNVNANKYVGITLSED